MDAIEIQDSQHITYIAAIGVTPVGEVCRRNNFRWFTHVERNKYIKFHGSDL
jgi:hypothetical protein